MPDFSLAQLNDTTTAATSNLALQVGKAARNFACGLYVDYKQWDEFNPFPTAPLGGFIRTVWDTVCSESAPGLPPFGENPFTGGQCVGVDYSVSYRFYFKQAAAPGYTTHTTKVLGRLGGVVTKKTNPTNWSLGFRAQGSPSGAFVAYPDDRYIHNAAPYLDGSPPRLVITSVVRTDGQADTCGNVPVIPPSTPPPTTRLTEITNIIKNDGNTYSFPLTWNDIDADLNLNVDVGGVNFKFNVDGLTFKFGGDTVGGGGDITNQDVVNNINNSITNLGDVITNEIIDSSTTNTTTITTLVQDVRDAQCECPEDKQPPNEFQYDKFTRPLAKSATVDGLTDLAYVELHVSNFNNTNKIQYGDNSPNVLFAGWLEFRIGNNNLERHQLHFEHNLFIAPDNCTGFAYCCTYFSQGTAVYYIKKQL